MVNENAIETFNLTKTFKTKLNNNQESKIGFLSWKKTIAVKAIDNLNLEIKKGELFGLLGPNGAGKTTLVKMLCTLLPPDEGTAQVNGFDINTEPMKVKQSIGTLFSVGERGFFWRLNGYQNLEFFAAISNVPRAKRQERIKEVVKLVGLENNACELYQKYSGGMKRKLALARTLLPDPPVLLLDEPTTGLDVISSRNIRDFIKNTVIKEFGKTVVYTTHYIEEASQICDKIGIMSKGRLIICDSPNAIKNRIKKAELICIIVEKITQKQIEQLQKIESVIGVTEKNENLLSGQKKLDIQLKSLDQVPLIFSFLFSEKIRLLNFERAEPTLEEAFIELTRKRE